MQGLENDRSSDDSGLLQTYSPNGECSLVLSPPCLLLAVSRRVPQVNYLVLYNFFFVLYNLYERISNTDVLIWSPGKYRTTELHSEAEISLEQGTRISTPLPQEEYFITNAELLVHGDKKKADRLLLDFIIVLKFSIDNEPFHCLDPRQTPPTAPTSPLLGSPLGFPPSLMAPVLYSRNLGSKSFPIQASS